jgi:hypothetical protein
MDKFKDLTSGMPYDVQKGISKMANRMQHGISNVKLHHQSGGSQDYLAPPNLGYHAGGERSRLGRRSSIASFASVMRKSGSVASILALAEEPTRAAQATKLIENNTLRVPSNVDHQRFPPELISWAKSPHFGELKSSAQLISLQQSHGVRMLVDNDERMIAIEG